MKKRVWIILIIVIALVAAGFLYYKNLQNKSEAAMLELETEAASLGSLTDIIGGTGTVRTKQTATLIWQTSGIVNDVNVGENEQVQKDFVLADLDGNSLSQSIISAQAELINLQQQLDDLYKNKDVNLAQAELDVITAQEELDDLLEDRVWLDYARCDQDTIDLYWDEYKEEADKVVDLEGKYDGSSSMRDRISEAKTARDTALANYNYCALEREPSEIAEADSKIAKAEANLAIAQDHLDTLKENNPNPDEVAAIEAQIAAVEATANSTFIEAPFAGTVTQVNVLPGDQVSSGISAFRMDDLSELLVDVNISEVDINRLQVGQAAELSYDSAYGLDYEGTVSKIASVGTNNQGVVEFTVTISLNNPDENIKPGMSAVVNIVVDEFEDALLVPNQAIRVVDGQRVVYVLKNDGSLQEVPVTIGITSSSHSQVLNGDLKEGDKVILNPPENSSFMEMRPGGSMLQN